VSLSFPSLLEIQRQSPELLALPHSLPVGWRGGQGSVDVSECDDGVVETILHDLHARRVLARYECIPEVRQKFTL